jgi:hypothetical protein
VDRRERPAEKAGRPRAFLARMISSKRRIEGSAAGLRSRSWMNSLNAERGVVSYLMWVGMGESACLPCVSRIRVAYSCWS